METKILPNETRTARKQFLKDSCASMEEFAYPKKFTEEELTLKKDQLSQEDIKLDKLIAEKKQAVSVFNAKIKLAKQERSAVLACVRTGMEEVSEQVYLVDDQEEGKMGYYNDMGDLVHCRPLLQEERQLRMIQTQTGTNN